MFFGKALDKKIKAVYHYYDIAGLAFTVRFLQKKRKRRGRRGVHEYSPGREDGPQAERPSEEPLWKVASEPER